MNSSHTSGPWKIQIQSLQNAATEVALSRGETKGASLADYKREAWRMVNDRHLVASDDQVMEFANRAFAMLYDYSGEKSFSFVKPIADHDIAESMREAPID